LAARADALVFFESPRRIGATLRELADALGDRRACVARELTKLHEEIARGTLSELAERFADGVRGEVTLVVEGAKLGAQREETSDEAASSLDDEIRARLARGDGVRELAAELAKARGLPRRQVYARALALRDTPAPSPPAPSARRD